MTDAATVPGALSRVAFLSVHTSPLDQPGAGDGGGLNVYVREIACRLAQRGVQVDVFTRATEQRTGAVPFTDGVTVHHVEAGPARSVPKDDLGSHLCSFAMAMQRHPLAGSHDLVHAHYWLSGWVGRRLARRWRVPLVQTFHTLGVLKNSTLAPGDEPESPLRLAAESRIARSADRILGLTCGEARLLHDTFGLSGARIAVVPAGVDLAVFRPDGPEAEPADLPAGDGPLLLFVGRLQRLKGPEIALRTLAEVRREIPDARLLVVGGASGSEAGRVDRSELEAVAAELGVADGFRVVDPRPQADLARLYRSSDVVLTPSRSETFGLVALEAQACGTPVVGASVPGLEYVVRDGGTLVDGHDPAAHAGAVLVYLRDPDVHAAASLAGIEAGRRASWEVTVDRLLDVYGRTVAESRGAGILERAS